MFTPINKYKGEFFFSRVSGPYLKLLPDKIDKCIVNII